MKKTLLIIFAFFSFECWSQGNMIMITGTVPSQMTICGVSKPFTISIYNASPFLLSNDTLKITMPPGIIYQAGTITGASYLYTSAPNTVVFLLASIPTLTTVNISYSAAVNCNVMPHIAGGGTIENNIRVNYTANSSIVTYDTYNTPFYIVRQPNLSITAVTNQSYTGDIGDVFTRCVTVINGGLGELSQFTLTDVHGAGIQISAATPGTLSNAGATATMTLTASDFVSVGDGDNLFENGESITICETVTVLNCSALSSAFEAYWGCNGQHCQSSVSNANVVFPNSIPNLVIVPNSGSIYSPMNSCFNQATQQQLMITNTGAGQATNIALSVFQATGSGYDPNGIGSNIDPNSFTTQSGLSSAPSAIVPTAADNTAAMSCMAPNAKGKVYLSIPTINPGDTVYIKWNTYSCCWNACTGFGQSLINGWRYNCNYENICGNAYVVPENWGRVYSYVSGAVTTNYYPSTLNSGQIGTVDFLFTNYSFSYPVGPGARWKFVFTLPPCLNYAGNLQILNFNGTSTWQPSVVTTSGSTVTAVFNGTVPFDLTNSEIKIDLSADCASCGGAGGGAVEVSAFYIPDTTCACEVGVFCQSTPPISVNCPSSCTEGLIFTDSEMRRINYGLPDNEPGGGDGLADGSGSLDFTKIRSDRAMFGDTISASISGYVRSSLAHPTWQYCYASSSMINGIYLSFLDAKLTVYRGGSLIATCNTFAPTISDNNSTRLFVYDLSVATLGGCLPLSFVYSDNDSLVFTPRYKVTVNSGGGPLNCNSTNEFYLSDIANPVLSSNKFQCGGSVENVFIIGYYFTNNTSENYSVRSCDNVVIAQSYHLGIGQCCNNYAGGNLFPFEYRNWAHIQNLTSIIPANYEFVSARFNQIRTMGTLQNTTFPWVSLIPVNLNSDTLEFPVEQYFQGYGGNIPLSDDGFDGTLEITLRTSCRTTASVAQGIQNDWTFSAIGNLTGPGSVPTFLSVVQDYIVYEAPSLTLQSTLPSINAPNIEANWNISIFNPSNVSNALNTWLSGPTISGVTIIQIFDVDNNVIIPATGSIYQVGTVNASTARNFRITATYTSCLQDSITLFSGWNCSEGYPTDIASYPCTAKTIKLKLTPLQPTLIPFIAGPSTVQLCDTASYTAEGINVQLGTAYYVKLSAVLPVGVTIVPGSSQLSYPVVNPFVSISDPVFIGGTTWQWDVSAISSLIGTDGLKGILEPALNSFKVAFDVIPSCGYTSGSRLGVNIIGQAACGSSTGQEVALSEKLDITGANPPYVTEVELVSTYISPCANNSSMQVIIHNRGAGLFGINDSVSVQLPAGVSYINGSFAPTYNAPANGVPMQLNLNGFVYLKWQLPQGIATGDSVLFSFIYKGNPDVLLCDISEFRAQTISSVNVNCASTGSNCGIQIVTGDTALSVFTYKAYLSLSNGSAISIPNPPAGETVTVNVDITNTGEAILTGANSIIEFYFDSNGNSTYNPGDVFLAKDTLLVTNNATVPYSKTFNVPAGQACSIIATIRTAVNPCVCDPSQLRMIPAFMGNDSITVCSGDVTELYSLPVNGYSYSWSPSAGLSDSSIANPTLTANITTVPVSTTYLLTTTRMSCISTDTVQVKLNPVPISDAGTDTASCSINTLGTIGSPFTAGYSYGWLPATGLSSTTVSNPAVALNISGSTTYTVTTTAFGCSSADSVNVRVNPLPTATIAGTSAVCKSDPAPIITFKGASGTPPYTLTYTINGGAYQTLTTGVGDSVTIAVSTAISDTFSYALVSIQESSSTACSQLQTGNATVIVHPIPVSNAGADILSCSINTLGTIGAPLTSGYSYNWLPATGLSSTTIANPGVSLNVPGSITYTVTTTALGCSSLDSVIVRVNPLPVATIAGTATVCQNDATQYITFKGASGTPPYLLTYTINGGANQAITTSVGDSVTISIPTAISDSLTFALVSIQESSSTSCSQLQTGSATVIINPLPVADFSAADVCFNQAVYFFDSSTVSIGNIDEFSWNFDDNGLTDSVKNPTYLYTSPGTYSVTFIITTNNGCKDTVAKPVVVHPLPVANFSTIPISIGVCDDETVSFNDGSTIGAPDNIQAWSWDFGDASPQNSNQNTSHLYAAPNSYTIQLAVISNFGCADSITQPLTINPNPKVNFTGSPVSGCEPLCVSFIDSSFISAGGNIQWTWDIGDGTFINNSQNFEHCYTNDSVYLPVNFNISLTVTSDSGCVSTVSKNNYITVYPEPVADFLVDPETTTVINPVASFINLSTGANFWTWSFGDLATSVAENPPPHAYTADTGTYRLSLITTTQYGCADTAYKTFFIDADFAFYIPNSFTPNEDGVNDFFFGKGIGIIEYDLWIFDRWGNMIFHGNGLPTETVKWNGKANVEAGMDTFDVSGNKSVAQRDVYVWKVKLRDVFTKTHDYIGTVTLVK